MSDSPFPLEPTPAEAQAAIAEEFGFFGDWSERYQYLIDLGRKLPPFPEEWKVEERAAAKQARDFARADAIRDQLAGEGIALEDTPQGVRWTRKRT